MTPEEIARECSLCKALKPLCEFHAHASYPHGRDYVCKPCKAERAAIKRNTGVGAGKKRAAVTLTIDRLKECMNYDAATGVFTRKIEAGGRKAGEVVGTLNPSGYLRASIDNHEYPLHALAWMHATGEWYAGRIDHINGNTTDNRIANLRPATAGQNRMNSKMSSNNKSGARGVYWHKSRNRWVAAIRVNKRVISLGGFHDMRDAIEAYEHAARKYFGSFVRGDCNADR